MALTDPLAKPEWSPVDPEVQEALVSLLVPISVRGTTLTEKVGFNASMAALESYLHGGPKVAAVFVARSDLSAIERLPLALACVAGSVKLAALPQGASDRLNTGIMAITEDSQESAVIRLAKDLSPPKLDWVYNAAEMQKKSKTNKK